ncbi:Uncharacterized protein dnl_41560 [Desulfonema limicola]|uniref:Zinc-finger domain-containing protein n=1 Tax=Desulfonema limicola TaxID=45656 RepID=A0A975GHR4_9BACT|nr:hypothetical protein [Desulfonema limicola]QTA81806.1 Uncharacterized protein dnl_41560 [Desulfonema limicola]
MTDNKKIHITQALESEKDFFDFLEQEVSVQESSLEKQAEILSHPDHEKLYSYVTEQLDDRDDNMVLEHISSCKICAETVFKIRMIEEDMEQDALDWADQVPVTEQISRLVSNLWEKISARPLYWASGFSMAAACVLLFFLMPGTQKNDMSKFLTEQTVIMQTVSEKLKIPLETTGSYSFASSKKSPASRAFGAGFWTAGQNLEKNSSSNIPDYLLPDRSENEQVNADKWTETSWSVYYHMGYWSCLLSAACQSDISDQDQVWLHQTDILYSLESDFAENKVKTEEDNRIITMNLEKIKTILVKSNKKYPGKIQCRMIIKSLDNIIGYMTP